MTTAFVVLNPLAGEERVRAVRRILAESLAADDYAIHETDDGGGVHEEVLQASREGYDVILAAGGDGTVSSVAAGLEGTDVPLGIIPLGTSNSLARELSIPLDVPGAVALALGENSRLRIDGMRADGRFCLLNVGIGLSPRIMRGAKPEEKRRLGRLAYVIAGAKALLGFQPTRFDIEMDGREMDCRAAEVLVLNSGTLSDPSLRWGSDIRIDDGRMDLCVIRAKSLPDYIPVGLHLLFGDSEANGDSHVQCYAVTHRLTISTRDSQSVQGDGELIGRTPVTVELVPGAVDIIVPVGRGSA